MDAEFLTVVDAARRLRLHVETVRKMIREGRIASVKIGKQYLIEPKDIDELIAEYKRPKTVANTPASAKAPKKPPSTAKAATRKKKR